MSRAFSVEGVLTSVTGVFETTWFSEGARMFRVKCSGRMIGPPVVT